MPMAMCICAMPGCKAPALIASYRKMTNVTSKLICHMRDGTPRDGGPARRRPRFLTPRECARLMGFPDTFMVPPACSGRSGIYKQLGNAVCPPLVSAVGERVLSQLDAARKYRTDRDTHLTHHEQERLNMG